MLLVIVRLDNIEFYTNTLHCVWAERGDSWILVFVSSSADHSTIWYNSCSVSTSERHESQYRTNVKGYKGFWRAVPEFAWSGWRKSWKLQSGWLVSGTDFKPILPEYGTRALTTGRGSTLYCTLSYEQKSMIIRAINDQRLAVRLFVRLSWTRLINEKLKFK